MVKDATLMSLGSERVDWLEQCIATELICALYGQTSDLEKNISNTEQRQYVLNLLDQSKLIIESSVRVLGGMMSLCFLVGHG